MLRSIHFDVDGQALLKEVERLLELALRVEEVLGGLGFRIDRVLRPPRTATWPACFKILQHKEVERLRVLALRVVQAQRRVHLVSCSV